MYVLGNRAILGPTPTKETNKNLGTVCPRFPAVTVTRLRMVYHHDLDHPPVLRAGPTGPTGVRTPRTRSRPHGANGRRGMEFGAETAGRGRVDPPRAWVL